MARKSIGEYILLALIGVVVTLGALIVFSGVAVDAPLNNPIKLPDLPPLAVLDKEQTEDEQQKEENKEAEAQPEQLTDLQIAQKYIKDAVYAGESLSCTKNGILYKVDNDEKKIALTFDDGPAGKMTDKYLAVLDEYDAKATFFLLGQWVNKYPEQAKNIAAAGHEVGSHSWAHHNLPTKDKEFIKEDFAKAEKAFKSTFGYTPTLFRPPYGATNSDMFSIAKGHGMLYVMWNNDEKDYLSKDADALAKSIIDSVSSGSVILMHENKKVTLAALPKIISGLQKKGYEFVTLSELIYDVESAKDEAQTAE